MTVLNIGTSINHIENCISKADMGISKLTTDILQIEGFSGNKTRHLYNNICDIDNATYLEVGTYMGSSFISSMYKNNINGIAVDNWSEFNGPKIKCLNNIKKYLLGTNNIKIIEKDFMELSFNDIGCLIDIYLYDGQHTYEAQKNAITYMQQFLSDLSIIIIDDFRRDQEWKQVVEGTMDGFEQSGLKILHKKSIFSLQEANGRNTYWNGCGIFLCQK